MALDPDIDKKINENYLFIQAFNLYKEAERSQKKSYIKALNLYKQALALIDSIPERFPSSNLAIKIAQRKVRLGLSSYAQIQRKIVRLRLKAAREELITILHDCALSIASPETRVDQLCRVALLAWQCQQKNFALNLFSAASDAIDAIDSEQARNNALSILAIKFADIGEYERALTLAVYLTELTDQVRLLTDLGSVYYQKKLRERARQLFNNALELVEREENVEAAEASAAWIAFKLAESSEFFWALEVSERITEPNTRVAIVQQIASKLMEFGKFGSIEEVTKRIDDHQVKAELLSTLVGKYAEEGYFSQARDALESVGVQALKARSLIVLAREYNKKKLAQQTENHLQEAIELADKITVLGDKVVIYTSAAELLYELRNESRACELVRMALGVIESFTDKHKRAEFLTFLVQITLKINQIAQAHDLLTRIKLPSSRNKALIEIAAKISGLDQLSEALDLVSQVDSKGEQLRGYFRVMSENPENRNFKVKLDLLEKILVETDDVESSSEADLIRAECAKAYARFEKFHYSLQIMEKVSSTTIRDNLLWELADMKFNTGFFMEGIEVLRLIQAKDRKVSRFIELGLAILQKKYENSDFGVCDFLPIAFSFWLEERGSF